jgi:hypothetical protein
MTALEQVTLLEPQGMELTTTANRSVRLIRPRAST